MSIGWANIKESGTGGLGWVGLDWIGTTSYGNGGNYIELLMQE